jgi:ornithine cyclodeaminase
MTDAAIYTEAQLREVVRLDLSTIDAIEQAFFALATQPVVMPPILRLDIVEHRGEVDVKTAYVPGLESFAIKISPGFFNNPQRGLPSLNGLMVLLSSETGLLEAIVLDNGYLTAVRTAAAGAVAARWLSRPDARVAAVIGAGEQARLQLRALTLVRPIEAAWVWAPNAAQAQAYAQDMTAELGLSVRVAQSVTQALAAADVAVSATPSSQPLIQAADLHPGLHVTAMGSDAEHKNEVAPQVFASLNAYVCDRLSQVRVLGELHHAIDAGVVSPDASFAELGQVIAGQQPGRQSPQDITLCDLTGTGVQDTAIATLARQRLAL